MSIKRLFDPTLGIGWDNPDQAAVIMAVCFGLGAGVGNFVVGYPAPTVVGGLIGGVIGLTLALATD